MIIETQIQESNPLTETMPRVGSRTPTEAPGATTDGGGHGRSPSLLTPEKIYPDINTNKVKSYYSNS